MTTTLEDVATAIDDCHPATDGLRHVLRTIASRIETVADQRLLEDITAEVFRRLKIDEAAKPEQSKAVEGVPDGFEACKREEATTGGYHNEQRLAARGDGGVEIVKLGEWNPPDIIWLRPIPQPDPERLADEIERSGVHSNASVPMADIVRRALARCRT